MHDPIRSTKRFDQAAATWDEKPRRVALAAAIGERIVRELQPTAEMDVLDYGCGTGLLSLYLAPLVRSVTGADSSTGMLDVLRGKIAQTAVDHVDVMRLDLQTDAPPRKQFHLITTAMTLHHVRDTDKVLAAFHQLLCPGGSLCIADLDSEPGTFHTGDEARSIPHHGFDRNELKNQLAAHGFAGLCDMTAFTIEKETENGQVRDFPVFLILARRPQ